MVSSSTLRPLWWICGVRAGEWRFRLAERSACTLAPRRPGSIRINPEFHDEVEQDRDRLAALHGGLKRRPANGGDGALVEAETDGPPHGDFFRSAVGPDHHVILRHPYNPELLGEFTGWRREIRKQPRLLIHRGLTKNRWVTRLEDGI